MSGGVDSSVAAFFLREKGYQVTGAVIDTGFGHAPEQAANICRQLGIECRVIKAADIFRQRVIEPFVNDYLEGKTPNPCVNCNERFKFPIFLPLMDELGADNLATGHYCRIGWDNGAYYLQKALAGNKDQTYFLYRLSQDILSHCLFPLGEYSKEQVRRIAAENGLASAGQKDSFDICFIEDGDYRRCVRNYAHIVPRPGDMVDMQGRVVGSHQGLLDYTIGQRKGIGAALGYPAYVVGMDHEQARLILGSRQQLNADSIKVERLTFIDGRKLSKPIRAMIKIRCQAPPVYGWIKPDPDFSDKAEISFEEPVWAPAAGQSAVFYDNDILLGGGIIQ